MNNNSIARYNNASPRELQETLGITQFGADNSWDQTIGGLIFQGGKVTDAGEVLFRVPLKKQLLYLNCAGGVDLDTETLNGFTATAAGYWFAIGV